MRSRLAVSAFQVGEFTKVGDLSLDGRRIEPPAEKKRANHCFEVRSESATAVQLVRQPTLSLATCLS